jgi:hypothetical protein
MSIRQFIKEHRLMLDTKIRIILKKPNYKLNDEERRQWILNDEDLYRYARSYGVNI